MDSMELIASRLAIFGVRQLIFCGKSIISQDFFCWLSLQQSLWDLFYEFLKRNESVAKYRVINCLVKCISIGFHFNLVIKILDISALVFLSSDSQPQIWTNSSFSSSEHYHFEK